MTDESVFEKVGELKIIPVLAVEETEKALPLVEQGRKGELPPGEGELRRDAAGEGVLGATSPLGGARRSSTWNRGASSCGARRWKSISATAPSPR